MKGPREYQSEEIERLQKEIDDLSFYKKLKMWINLQKWVFICRTRFIWDLNYEHNIFRKKICSTRRVRKDMD